MATRVTMASRGMCWAAAAAFLLGCASSGGASGETHFVCTATPDCSVHGAGYTCVHGTCRSLDGGAGATADASMSSGPMGGGTSAAGSATNGGGAGGNAGNRGAAGGAAGGADVGTGRAGAGGSVGEVGSGGIAGGGGRPADLDATTDAPTRSPRGAVTLHISPTPGFSCNHTAGQLGFPFADRAGVEAGLLRCDTTTGCRPDEFVFEDGADPTHLICSVVPNGGNFLVTVNLLIAGSPGMSLGLTGTLPPSGGTLSVEETNSLALGGGSDPTCSVQLLPNMSFLEPGKIWARFTCTHFRDPNDLSDTGCTVDGAFLFENCSR